MSPRLAAATWKGIDDIAGHCYDCLVLLDHRCEAMRIPCEDIPEWQKLTTNSSLYEEHGLTLTSLCIRGDAVSVVLVMTFADEFYNLSLNLLSQEASWTRSILSPIRDDLLTTA